MGGTEGRVSWNCLLGGRMVMESRSANFEGVKDDLKSCRDLLFEPCESCLDCESFLDNPFGTESSTCVVPGSSGRVSDTVSTAGVMPNVGDGGRRVFLLDPVCESLLLPSLRIEAVGLAS